MYNKKIKLNFNFKHLKYIINLLSATGKVPRLIGGCVRDQLYILLTSSDNYKRQHKSNKNITDIDIAAPMLPNEVFDILREHNIKTVTTGIEYGTVTAIIENEKFEITTLRKDIECYGRDVKVEFTEDFAEDAARRDFTINALSYDLYEEKIYDYFNGLSDLENSKVVFIGDPAARIKEDYLRILRFFRFSGIYALKLDQAGYKAAIELKSGLKLLAKERIIDELNKILLTPNYVQIIEFMDQGGFFPEINSDMKVNSNLFRSLYDISIKLNLKPTLATRYALLLCYVEPSKLQNIFINLRMPKQLIKNILELNNGYSGKSSLYSLWFKDPELFKQKILYLTTLSSLPIENALSILEKFDSHSPIKFPINGKMLLKLGLKGKNIKNWLEILQLKWVESRFSLSPSELIKFIENGEK